MTYGTLCQTLNFHGVELLVIDVEGHDCEILQSMIEYCKIYDGAWPEVIQFETMGHNGSIGSCSEADMCLTSQRHGYHLVSRGNNSIMVRRAALDTQPRIQRWAERVRCDYCGSFGVDAFPFYCRSFGSICRACRHSCFCFSLNWNAWYEMPALDGRIMTRVCTDGKGLWGVDTNGCVHKQCGQNWKLLTGNQSIKELSVSAEGEFAIGVDDQGRAWHGVHITDGPLRWVRAPSEFAIRSVSLKRDGKTAWLVGEDGRVYAGNWSRKKCWRGPHGYLKQITMSHDVAHIWAVNVSGRVYQRNAGFDVPWTQASAPTLCRISCSGDGRSVWGIDLFNSCLLYTSPSPRD